MTPAEGLDWTLSLLERVASRIPQMTSPTTPTPIISLPNSISVRSYVETDDAGIARHANNAKIANKLTDRFPHPYELSNAQWWISFCRDPENWIPTLHSSEKQPSESRDEFNARQKDSRIPADYAICHNDEFIGSVGLQHNANAGPRTLELGYWLGEEYWGRGLATQVAKAFVSWAFEAFPWAVRIEANAYGWNVGSQNVLRKVGFELEGVQKMKAFKGGRYGDLVLFGMIRPGFDPTSSNSDAL